MDSLSIPWENSSQSVGNATLEWNNSTPAFELALEETKLPTWFLVLYIFVRAIEGILALLGNSLTVAAIIKFEFLRTTSNILVCGLAMADIIGGLSPIWMVGQYALRENFATWHIFCVIDQVLALLASYLNVSIITAIAVDRCIYISYPLRYPNIVTSRVAIGSLVFIWVLCASEVVIFLLLGIGRYKGMDCRSRNLFPSQAFRINNEIAFYTTTIIIVIMYSRIVCIAYNQAKRVEEVHLSLDQEMKRKAEYKVTKMMVVILGFFFLSYIPQMVFLTVVRDLKYQPVHIIMIERVLSCGWWLSSWVNPFIYAWKSKAFTRGFRLLLHIKSGPVGHQSETREPAT